MGVRFKGVCLVVVGMDPLCPKVRGTVRMLLELSVPCLFAFSMCEVSVLCLVMFECLSGG